jgi:hypothetical protein
MAERRQPANSLVIRDPSRYQQYWTNVQNGGGRCYALKLDNRVVFSDRIPKSPPYPSQPVGRDHGYGHRRRGSRRQPIAKLAWVDGHDGRAMAFDGSFRWVDLSMTEPSLTATNEFTGLSMAIGRVDGRVDGRIERAIVWLMGIEASRSALGSSAIRLDVHGPNAVLPRPPPLAAASQRC